MPIMHGTPVEHSIQIDADGPLIDEVTDLIRQAIQNARGGWTTHLIDHEFCVAEIGPARPLDIPRIVTVKGGVDWFDKEGDSTA